MDIDDCILSQMDEPFEPAHSKHSMTLPSSSAPVPPPMPSTDPAIRFQLHKLQEQVEILENIISEPQIIAITGVQNLNPETGNNWKDRLTTLLFEACIPYFWTIQIVPDEDIHIDPNLAYIYFLNNTTKNKAKEMLTHFLQSTYKNNVCIL
jgi:hypothetical protein